MTLAGTIRLDKLGNNAHRDSPAEGKGTPNYLAGLAVTKDGSRLLVVSNKMNSDKGLLVGADLDQDNTVRNLLTFVDTTTNEVLKSIDLDNSDSASAIAVGPSTTTSSRPCRGTTISPSSTASKSTAPPASGDS